MDITEIKEAKEIIQILKLQKNYNEFFKTELKKLEYIRLTTMVEILECISATETKLEELVDKKQKELEQMKSE